MNKCIDCQKIISRYAKRCHSCNVIHLWQTCKKLQLRDFSGDKNPMAGKIGCWKGKKRPEHSKLMQGKNHPRWIKDLIRNCIDCGKKLGKFSCYEGALRCKSCARKYQYATRPETNNLFGRKMETSYTWQGGKSFEPYTLEFTEQLKEQIRKRDNHTCQNCGMAEEEHLIVYGRSLCIHHIDYNKINCSEDNLITLCNGCNLRANHNRNYWTDYYINKTGIKNDKNNH